MNEDHVKTEIPKEQIDYRKLDKYIESLRPEQNFNLAVIAGIAATLIGAIAWAVITVATEYQIGFMAVGVGLIVGFTIREAGKGIDKKFGLLGASLALLGCLLGNFLSMVGFISAYVEMSYFETLISMDYSLLPELFAESFNVIDILFYGIALSEGYKFAFRKITDEEILKHAKREEPQALENETSAEEIALEPETLPLQNKIQK